MSEQELAMYEALFMAEQSETLDCTEDAAHDLHEDSEGWYQELSGSLFAGLL